MTAVKTSYKHFIAELREATGYSPKEITAILKKNGFESFKSAPQTELRATVLGHHALATSIGDQMKEYEAKFPQTPEALECPVPSCDGVKTSVRRRGVGVGKWRCSVGGPVHWIVWRTAVSMSLQFPDRTVEEWMTYLLEARREEEL